MGLSSGLLAHSRGVRAFFSTYGVQATVAVGWNARFRNGNQSPGGANRVVFIPGVWDGSASPPKVLKAGTIDRDGPQDEVTFSRDGIVVARARPIGWWHYPATVCVWAVSSSNPQDEEGQISATESLLEQTVRAMHNATDPETGQVVGAANIQEWGDPFWVLPPGEGSFGREIAFAFTLLVPLFNQPIEIGYPETATIARTFVP